MRRVLLLALYLLLCFAISLLIHNMTTQPDYVWHLLRLPALISDVSLPMATGEAALLLIISAVILHLVRQRTRASGLLTFTLLAVYGFVPRRLPSVRLGCTFFLILSLVILDLLRRRFKTSSNLLALIMIILMILENHYIISLGSVGEYRDLFTGFIIPVGLPALCLVRSTVSIWKGQESLIHALIFIVAMLPILLVTENMFNPYAYSGFFVYETV